MKTKTRLITVPNFTFNQGDVFSGIGNSERPIQVRFYNGSIELVQDGEFVQPNSIHILPEYLNEFFGEIKNHLPVAKKVLAK